MLDITGEASEGSDAVAMDGDGDIELPMADARLLVCPKASANACDVEVSALNVADRVRVYWAYQKEWSVRWR